MSEGRGLEQPGRARPDRGRQARREQGSDRRGYLPELDVVRFWSIVGVLAIHLSIPLARDPSSTLGEIGFAMLLNQVARFCVPAFIFISGLLITYRNACSRGVGRFWAGRLWTVLPPYLVWTALGLWFTSQYATVTRETVWRAFLWGQGHFYQLYFIPLILQLYLLAPLLDRALRGRVGGYVATALMVFQVAYLTVYEAAYLGAIDLPQETLRVWMRHIQPTFPAWIGYFAVGMWTGFHYETLRRRVERLPIGGVGALFIFTLGAVLLDYDASFYLTQNLFNPGENFMRPAVVAFSVAALLLMGALGVRGSARMGDSSRVRRAVLHLGRLSFGIYLAHLAVHDGLMRVWPGLYETWYGTAAAIASVLIASAILTEVADRVPGGGFVLGSVRKRRGRIEVHTIPSGRPPSPSAHVGGGPR